MRDKREEVPRRHSKDLGVLACTTLGAAGCGERLQTGHENRMQTPGLYDDGRKVNLSQPTNGRGDARSWTRDGDRVGTTEQAAVKWPRRGSWRLVEVSRVKTISIPPVALSRSVGSGEVGGGRWVLDGWGVRRAGETKSSVGVSTRAAEDQDVERRPQLGRWEGLVAPSCVTVWQTAATGLEHGILSASASTALWCARVLGC